MQRLSLARFCVPWLCWLAMSGCREKPAPVAPAPPSPVVTIPPPTSPPPVIAHPLPPPELRLPVMDFRLPTKNDALFKDRPAAYFMFVDRTIQGVATQVWEGGQYGFVRDPKMATDGKIVYTRFHEGMDVAPVQRDAKGEPMDEVFAIADGTVKYANASGKSNYGNYVIVEHLTEDGPFYSLYAHLRLIVVQRGDKVQVGSKLGMMGHTGSGIDRRRSHTHVELNLLLHQPASIWECDPAMPTTPALPASKPPAPPALNGTNLVGLDIAGWLQAHHADPYLRLADFMHRAEPYFKIRTPCNGTELEITRRYPWLRTPGKLSRSWEISIAATSIPLKIEPLDEQVEFTTVSWVQPFVGNHAWKSRELLTGSGSTASLSAHGQEYVKLLLGH